MIKTIRTILTGDTDLEKSLAIAIMQVLDYKYDIIKSNEVLNHFNNLLPVDIDKCRTYLLNLHNITNYQDEIMSLDNYDSLHRDLINNVQMTDKESFIAYLIFDRLKGEKVYNFSNEQLDNDVIRHLAILAYMKQNPKKDIGDIDNFITRKFDLSYIKLRYLTLVRTPTIVIDRRVRIRDNDLLLGIGNKPQLELETNKIRTNLKNTIKDFKW